MEFKLKDYKGNKYIEYFDEKRELMFTNAEYFIFDVLSEEFKEIMRTTGGFVANMTTRHIKENQLDAAYIMLCCIPQEYNNFVFKFVYLDKNYNILTSMYDNNYFDYDYFKKKFSDCIVKEGFIYDLNEIDTFNDLVKEFNLSPSINFYFKVEGKDISYNDTFKSTDFSIFKEDIRKNLEKLKAKAFVLNFDSNYFNFIGTIGKIIGPNDEILLFYQIESGILDREEYIKFMQEEEPDFSDKDVFDEEFTFNLTLSTTKTISNKLIFA